MRMMGPGMDPNNPSISDPHFALLHSVVQTFSGIAQILESTFMATHSSFFTMISLAS